MIIRQNLTLIVLTKLTILSTTHIVFYGCRHGMSLVWLLEVGIVAHIDILIIIVLHPRTILLFRGSLMVCLICCCIALLLRHCCRGCLRFKAQNTIQLLTSQIILLRLPSALIIMILLLLAVVLTLRAWLIMSILVVVHKSDLG